MKFLPTQFGMNEKWDESRGIIRPGKAKRKTKPWLTP
jgi:hypothetical protein